MTTHADCMASFLRDQMQTFRFKVDSHCPFCSERYMGFAEAWERHSFFLNYLLDNDVVITEGTLFRRPLSTTEQILLESIFKKIF